MAAKIPDPPNPPRYHASRDKPGPSAQYPGLVFARLTCMPPELWEQVEAYLRTLGFRPF